MYLAYTRAERCTWALLEVFWCIFKFGVSLYSVALKFITNYIAGVWVNPILSSTYFDSNRALQGAILWVLFSSQDPSNAFEHGIKMTPSSGVGQFSVDLLGWKSCAKCIMPGYSSGWAFKKYSLHLSKLLLSPPTLFLCRRCRHQKHVTGPWFVPVMHWKFRFPVSNWLRNSLARLFYRLNTVSIRFQYLTDYTR